MTAEPRLQAYPCTPSQGAVLNAMLNEQFGSSGNVRIVHDRQSSQLLVMAPEAVQRQIAGQVRAAASVTASAPSRLPTQPLAIVPSPATGHLERREYQLRHVTAGRLHEVLRTALGSRWSQLPQAIGMPAAFQLGAADGNSLTVRLDGTRNRILLEGPSGQSYESCVRLIESLDAPRSTDGRARCLVSLTSVTTNDLREAVNAIHTTNGPVARRASGRILLAQATGPATVPSAAIPGAADEEATVTLPLPGGDQEGTGLIGPVQIEMLEGLGIIVIRGHKRDVEKVVKIIQEIETLSDETEPSIEIRPLNHVDCEALADLVNQLYDEVYSPRQGEVSITALVKPNALLLIGRPENVATAVNLVDRLDRPVPPESQFKVFRLRYAASTTAQVTVEEFFQNAEGDQQEVLGARVHVIADIRSNSLIVRASPRDMLEVGRMIAEIDTREVEAVNDLRVFPLKNSLADDLQPILQDAINGQGSGQNQQTEEKSIGLRFVTIDPEGHTLLNSGILTDVRVTADSNANALLISAPPESMPLIEALIHQLDQLPVAQAQLKVFTIVNGDAAALVEMLETLFGESTNQPEPPVRTGASGADSSLVSLQFAVDVRTNSIIASGSIGDLSVVEAILLRLDESEVQERRSVVYRLKNAPAADVASAINEYLDGEGSVRLTQEGLFSTFEIFEREVIVVAEPVSNSLIVSSTSKYYDEIADLVEQLDERPPMVMIQVLIAEVQLNDTEEFGIELGLQDSVLFDRGLLGDIQTITNSEQTSIGGTVTTVTEQIITSATNAPGFLFNDVVNPLGNSGAASATGNANVVGGQGISSFGVGRLNSELGFGGLVMSASSESLSILLRALKEDRRVDVLSRPQIMTLDNQPAFIQVGERVPRISGTSTNEAGQTNQIEMENVGLILGVTPRISPDGLVVMEIDAEKSAVGTEADGIAVSISGGQTIRSPRISTTLAQTTVAAMDGQTVVLAGLITSTKSKVDRRVPWLADIPVLGQLFQYQGFTKRRTELLIVMTPRIVDTEEDAEQIKQVEAARMSWCLTDVLEMHEDVAFRPRDGQWNDDETTTIYPDGKPAEQDVQSLENIPLDLPSPQPAPPIEPSSEARYQPFSRPTAPAMPGYVAPASYEGAAPSRAGGVYPAGGAYPSTYPSTTSYRPK